ncbi:hypothetical protein GGTG_10958 [Gaeumannomyces tritici R3-111a-1]|uniref:Uncharacterized protein n=1 Tax=Gaeumannomyces tritici (strain R3-111a-1) TaxID=644352 RepID=J3PBT7_GAET3|nr:hypothetical protein GGTG_10958 [Gaeumannomyces tritici R3-111a-1]EJT71704.1 hypothetical protein GGTG_10958 [Gaeumannomyces tritici R3-111a-1]
MRSATLRLVTLVGLQRGPACVSAEAHGPGTVQGYGCGPELGGRRKDFELPIVSQVPRHGTESRVDSWQEEERGYGKGEVVWRAKWTNMTIGLGIRQSGQETVIETAGRKS